MRQHLESFKKFGRLSRTLSVVSVLSRSNKAPLRPICYLIFTRRWRRQGVTGVCFCKAKESRRGSIAHPVPNLEANSQLKIWKSALLEQPHPVGLLRPWSRIRCGLNLTQILHLFVLTFPWYPRLNEQ